MTAPSRRPSFTEATCPTAKAAADAGITAAYIDGNLRVPTGYTNLPYPNGWDDPAAEETLASLTVTGAVAVGGDVAVNTDKFTVAGETGNTAVGGTLAVTGDVAVATDKFTVASASGNTVVAGTLGVTGAATLTGALAVGTNVTMPKEVNHTVSVDRSTTAATAGATLTVISGGATSGSTDKAGGDLTLSGGIGTGTGESSVILKAAASSGTGTTSNTPAAVLTITGAKMGFFGHAAAAQPAINTAALTSITHTAPTTPDYALQDLVQNTGFGFATADEGNTVLSVILNLQTRVAELETKLKAVGLMAAA
jgi:hypothetical protein